MARELNRILYVEDEPDIQVIGKLALEAVGKFQVSVASSGTDALRDAEVARPDLILLDVMMPGLDGPSTLRALRSMPALEHVPVIFMTAKVQANEVMTYKALGAIGVISKPFDPMQLASKVRSLWAEHHAKHGA